jgi:hypothetical protein
METMLHYSAGMEQVRLQTNVSTYINSITNFIHSCLILLLNCILPKCSMTRTWSSIVEEDELAYLGRYGTSYEMYV